MARWLKFLMIAVLLLMAVTIPLAMQRDTGSLEGVVTDDTGPIRGMIIQLERSTSGEMQQTFTNDRGSYRFDDLQRGRYTLWITAAEHEGVSIPVFIEAGVTLAKDVQLRSVIRSSVPE